METDACNFQHPPGAEARSFIASVSRARGSVRDLYLGRYTRVRCLQLQVFRRGCDGLLVPHNRQTLVLGGVD